MNEGAKEPPRIRPPEPILSSVDGSSAEASTQWWRASTNENRFLTEWYSSLGLEFTPPPTEMEALTEWVGQTAFAVVKILKDNPQEYNLGDTPPKTAARLLYKYAEALKTWHMYEQKGTLSNALIELGRIEMLEETLRDFNIPDYKFVLDAFTHVRGFNRPLIQKRYSKATDDFSRTSE